MEIVCQRIGLGLAASAILFSAALAGGHKSSGPPKDYYPGEEREYYVGNVGGGYPEMDGGSNASEEVTDEILGLIKTFASTWTGEDWITIPELFDRGSEPYILLAHQPDWLVGWDELEGYFSNDPVMPVKKIPKMASKGKQQIEMRHYEFRSEFDLAEMLYKADRITLNQIADDLAMATWYVDFQYKPKFTAAKAEHFKANAIFRKTDDGWKFIHYGEAPMAPIMYIERLYRSQVSNEFRDLLKAKEREKGGQ